MKKIFYSFLFFNMLISYNLVAGWVQLPDMPSSLRDRAAGFIINDVVYAGTGYINQIAQSDFWKYDTQTSVWTQIASLSNERHGASGFSFNGQGYIALGARLSPTFFYDDLQEYHPASNTWTFKSPLPATGRYGCSTISIGSKVYFIGGNFGSATGPFTDEVWEYDLSNDVWTPKSPYPEGQLYYTTAFNLNGSGYAGGGGYKSGSNYYFNNHFYKYDQPNDAWTPIADFPGGDRSGMVSVVLNSRVFVGTGNAINGTTFNSFFIYDDISDQWLPGPSLPSGKERTLAVGMSDNIHAFLFSGFNLGIGMVDLFELSDLVNIGQAEKNKDFVLHNRILTVSDASDNSHLKVYLSNGQLIFDGSGREQVNLNEGFYIASYNEKGENAIIKKLIVL